MRSHRCGDVRSSDAGSEVDLCGWIDSRRDHGGVIFVDLRDVSGVIQVVFSPEASQELHSVAEELRNEFCVRITGEVRARRPGTVNPKIATGEIEIAAGALEVLTRSETPPFHIDGHQEVDEILRLRHRYLDLRRPHMQKNLMLRHRIVSAIRRFFDDEASSRSRPRC